MNIIFPVFPDQPFRQRLKVFDDCSGVHAALARQYFHSILPGTALPHAQHRPEKTNEQDEISGDTLDICL